jgi:hypothetical protein
MNGWRIKPMFKDVKVILEIPHQQPANAWIAWSTDEFLDLVSSSGYDEDDEEYGELNAESALDWIRHDLHTAFLFEGPTMIDEMREFIKEYDGHQWDLATSIIELQIELFTDKKDEVTDKKDRMDDELEEWYCNFLEDNQ